MNKKEGSDEMLPSFLSETRSRIQVGSSIHDLAKSALGLITQELGFIGGSIYFFNEDTNILHHVLYESRKSSRLIHKVLDPHMTRLTCELGTHPQSELERSIKTKQRIRSSDITSVARGFVPDPILQRIQRSSKLQELLLNPVIFRGHIVGLLIVGSSTPFRKIELEAIDILSEQLAQPFHSMVEQTRLLDRLRDPLISKVPEKPTIKFTLRVTPTMHRELERRAVQEGLSKADIMRHAAAEYLEQQDDQGGISETSAPEEPIQEPQRETPIA